MKIYSYKERKKQLINSLVDISKGFIANCIFDIDEIVNTQDNQILKYHETEIGSSLTEKQIMMDLFQLYYSKYKYVYIEFLFDENGLYTRPSCKDFIAIYGNSKKIKSNAKEIYAALTNCLELTIKSIESFEKQKNDIYKDIGAVGDRTKAAVEAIRRNNLTGAKDHILIIDKLCKKHQQNCCQLVCWHIKQLINYQKAKTRKEKQECLNLGE